MFDKSQRINLFRWATILVITILAAACTGTEVDPADIVRQYYSAIENGDADGAEMLFSEDVVIVTPSGNTLSGDLVRLQFIPFDLQFMERVEFLTDFTVSNGKVYWSQKYHDVDGSSWINECEITVEDGKIVEWLFK